MLHDIFRLPPLPVRFFLLDMENEQEEPDIREVTELEFLTVTGPIGYERHTVSENGVSQICLTKDLL